MAALIAKRAVVAGYICLDLIPDLSSVPEGQFKALLQPGSTLKIGGVRLCAGGAVSNTGLALHKLGIPVRLIGKIGDDFFGQGLRDVISGVDPRLVDDLVVDPSASTAITIILNPPGFDRSFLHTPGASAGFYASDISKLTLQSSDLLHFGYPTLMRSIYRNQGAELISILQKARRAGLTTSLDFSLPDPTSDAWKLDWETILANCLPYVDLCLPSVAELIFLLRPEAYQSLSENPHQSLIDAVTPDLLHDLSETVLDYGVKVLLVKLGHRGVYCRTGGERIWKKTGRALSGLDNSWQDREIWLPAFAADVKGTTGAGDAAIAGFLSSLLRDSDLMTALFMAAAAGACSVESLDSFGGLLSWERLLTRVKGGWEVLPLDLSHADWRKNEADGYWERG